MDRKVKRILQRLFTTSRLTVNQVVQSIYK